VCYMKTPKPSCCSVLSDAKAHYENNQINDDPKRFWNYTRHFSRSSSSVDVLESENGKVTDDECKADILLTTSSCLC
jgi:hypothetical protein